MTFQYKLANTTNPSSTHVLEDCEPGYDKINNVLKIGDGTTPFNELEPIGGAAVVADRQSSYLIQRSIEGVVSETALMYWVAPSAGIITNANMYLLSAPSATDTYCKLQIMKNGTLETNSIFATDIPMSISDATSATNGIYQSAGTLDDTMTSFATGDVMHFRVNQADTGSVGLLVQVCINLPDTSMIDGGSS